ncbi:MAG: NAD(P)H-dependent glycerol-3-phosphate dehydrogenase [Rhodobacteraceae bacterium]|nr:NAD(P)H-dependent glycerol-3-phosphate dehydrogenase [Paracoccaceae bacterium]
MSVAVLGAGAFGTALAVALSRNGAEVTLYARDGAAQMNATRENAKRLPGVVLPDSLSATATLETAAQAETLLLAVPMQKLATFVEGNAALIHRKTLISCCKGIDLIRGLGPVSLLDTLCPAAKTAILTGPSFAADIAIGLPTALTLASADAETGAHLQSTLSTPELRLYLSDDTAGAELGGALKNVIALAAGLSIGAGHGESARAALITRGFAEMQRFARTTAARPETLAGLSGFGDLILTATSEKSRNYLAGLTVGQGNPLPAATTEGIATAKAVVRLARARDLDMPIASAVAAVFDGQRSVADVTEALLRRPLKRE